MDIFSRKFESKNIYRISSYSFRGKYSFLNLEIQRSQYIRPKVTVHKGAETIQGRKLYEEIRYVKLRLIIGIHLRQNDTKVSAERDPLGIGSLATK